MDCCARTVQLVEKFGNSNFRNNNKSSGALPIFAFPFSMQAKRHQLQSLPLCPICLRDWSFGNYFFSRWTFFSSTSRITSFKSGSRSFLVVFLVVDFRSFFRSQSSADVIAINRSFIVSSLASVLSNVYIPNYTDDETSHQRFHDCYLCDAP